MSNEATRLQIQNWLHQAVIKSQDPQEIRKEEMKVQRKKKKVIIQKKYGL